jgi:hypothetical protein
MKEIIVCTKGRFKILRNKTMTGVTGYPFQMIKLFYIEYIE